MIWLFPGRMPITSTNIIRCLKAAQEAKIDREIVYFSSVPYVLQMMAEDDAGMALLKQMDLVGVGGAALPASLGDHLVSEKINLVSRFGSIECGCQCILQPLRFSPYSPLISPVVFSPRLQP